eukprot:TRINITY_DN2851_c0_g5_i1.p1 TRINITY_DN2851_c0_g5~~TRINITY_DN2851_c0_g5_i1.p1  ORF type:complete len:736 (-),score=181.23 TRINITY_DN2851_c0_g5_i1:26-2206(-)
MDSTVGGSSSSSSRPPLPGKSGSASAPAVAAVAAAFPPAVSEADALLCRLAEPCAAGLDGISTASQAELRCRPSEEAILRARSTLRRWSDAILELVDEVARGPSSEIPVEEVWHWLAASERLTRCLSFAEHFSVEGLAARLETLGDQESEEVLTRWHGAVRQLRQAQKESGWNARYLRVVEEPLARLTDAAGLNMEALPKNVQTLLRSLHRIHCTSSQLREHRMAPLLHKMLKVLVAQATLRLTAPLEVASPPRGSEVALREAQLLRDSFRTYAEHFFLVEVGAPGSNQGTPRRGDAKRPNTALGSKGDRALVGAASARRLQGQGQQGWWSAMVRHSLAHAEHCCKISDWTVGLLADCSRLEACLPDLQAADAMLLREVRGFLELHSGVKGGGLGMAVLLDPKRCLEAQAQVAEVRERLDELLKRVAAAGISVPEEAAPQRLATACGSTEEPLEMASGPGFAEVLLLPDAELTASAGCPIGSRSRPGSAAELQESIDSMSEDLQQFSSQLDDFGALISKTVGQARSSRFAPPPRRGAGAAAAEDSGGYPSAARPESAEMAAALEVARRASWYVEPPPLLPDDIPMIEVEQKINLRVITRCPSRPRTAQPAMYIVDPMVEEEKARISRSRHGSRPATAESLLLAGSQRPSTGDRRPLAHLPAEQAVLPEAASEEQVDTLEVEAEEEDLLQPQQHSSAAAEEEHLDSLTEEEDSMDPSCSAQVAWKVS